MKPTIATVGLKAVEMHKKIREFERNETIDDILEKIEAFIVLCSRENADATLNANAVVTMGNMLVEHVRITLSPH